MSKLTLKEIRKIAIETKHDFRGAMEIIVPDSDVLSDVEKKNFNTIH
jgi:hypothetical protein